MNFKIIINILLVIFVVHLFLRNFTWIQRFTNQNVDNNDYADAYTDDNSDSDESVGEDRSLQFLMSSDPAPVSRVNEIENFSVKNSVNHLTDYVNKCKPVDVKPGNWYATDDNDPNFTSNVLNVNKFYDINRIGEFDGLNSDGLNQGLTPQNFVEPPIQKDLLKKVSEQTCFNQKVGDMRDNTGLDSWNYKNEMPMNGGQFLQGLAGFDNLESAYASYTGPGTETCDPSKPFNCSDNFAQKPDDLRFGLGLPNKEIRDTN